MIQGPGQYFFKDYVRLGVPFEIFLNIFQVLALAFSDVWGASVAVAFLFLVLCICVDHVFVEHRPFFSLTIFHPREWVKLLAWGFFTFTPIPKSWFNKRGAAAKKAAAAADEDSGPSGPVQAQNADDVASAPIAAPPERVV